MTKRRKRAALYLRISKDPTGQAAGVTRQDEDGRKLAAQLGADVVVVYSDNDESATKGPRDDYEVMLDDLAINRHRLDLVIAWHPDRLYRGRFADLQSLIDVVERHHYLIRTVEAGELDLATPTGRMLARILGAVAAQEVEHKAARWKRSYVQRRQAGEFVRSGPRHFGYTRDGQIVEHEAEIVRELAREILAGVKPHTLARRLNERGIRTTLGNLWRVPSLRTMVTSPRLAGMVVCNGQILVNVVGAWPAILERDVRERVCQVLDPKRGRPAYARAVMLSGYIKCREHRVRLYRSKRKGYPIWTCKHGDPNTACGHLAIQAEPIDDFVRGVVKEALGDKRVRRELAARLTQDPSNLMGEIDGLERKIAELEDELRQPGGKRSAASLRAAIDDLDEQAEAARAELAARSPVLLPEHEDDWPPDDAVDRWAALVGVVVQEILVSPSTKRGARFDLRRVEVVPVGNSTRRITSATASRSAIVSKKL